MSSVGSKGVIIQDTLGGDSATVTDGRLDVNATIGATVTVALDSGSDSVECIQDTAADLNATVNVIAGFATALKQPSLGTAGSASANVITVQGVASMTPLIVDLGSNNDVTGTFFPTDSVSLHNAANRGYVEISNGTQSMPTMDHGDRAGFVTLTNPTAVFGGAITAADNAIVILGAKANAKSAATDATAITMMQVLKQISASVQETATDTGTIDSDTNDIKTAVAIPTGMVSGVNTAVGTSVEDLVGSGSVAIKRIDLMADPSNTGYIWVGDASVANDGTGGGIRLGAGDFYSMDIDDLNEVHVAATVNAEDIMYTYYA